MTLLSASLSILLGCSGGADDTAEPWDRGPNPHQLDDVLRLNHVQTKGTHNSYHLEPDTVYDDSHRYSHPTLTEQLDRYGVRQLELDLHLTAALEWQVFHLPGLDEETACLALSDCLGEIRAWSDANGWHLPITIWLEPKDEIDELDPDLVLIDGHLLELDGALRAAFPPERLFTPDDLRGDAASLPEALAGGWPLLGEVRGQVIFALLDSGEHRDAYLDGAEALEGRAMFVDSAASDVPSAAFFKDGGASEITERAGGGFIITANGSAAGDTTEAAAAADAEILDAGVHHAATDFAAPNDDYWLDLAPRCNPVWAPPECDDAEIERLGE